MTSNPGIDYGLGTTNIDTSTGIRYGVINANEVCQAWSDSSEADYGDPHCPKCGNQADEPKAFGESFSDLLTGGDIPEDYTEEEYEQNEYVCVNCKHFFGSESAFGDSPLGFYVNDADLSAHCSDDGDIFITKSPFYTLCQFCSPCAPGAGYILNTVEDGVKAYCFGHDWFEEGKAPYPVYNVLTNELIESN